MNRQLFLVMLILDMQSNPATLAQSSFPINRSEPETSALYQQLIFHGTKRIEGKTEISTEDMQTVRITTNIKKDRVMFEANDDGLQAVWVCEMRDYRKARAPKKIVFSNTITKQIVRKGVKADLPGHPNIRVTLVVKPRGSSDAVILRKLFARLVNKYSEDKSFH